MTPEDIVSRINFTKVSVMSFEDRMAEREAIAADIRVAIWDAIAEQRETDAKIAEDLGRSHGRGWGECAGLIAKAIRTQGSQ